MLTEWKFHPAEVMAASNTCQTWATTRCGWMQVLWEKSGRAQTHSQPQKCPNFHTWAAGEWIPGLYHCQHRQLATGGEGKHTAPPQLGFCSLPRRPWVRKQKALSEESQLVNRAKGGSNQRGSNQGMKICTASSLRSVCSHHLKSGWTPKSLSAAAQSWIPKQFTSAWSQPQGV